MKKLNLPSLNGSKPNRILKIISEQWGIPEDTLTGDNQKRRITFPRHIAMYILRKNTDMTLAEIGTMFGGRDHSTVIYAQKCVKSNLSNQGLVEIIARVENEIINL